MRAVYLNRVLEVHLLPAEASSFFDSQSSTTRHCKVEYNKYRKAKVELRYNATREDISFRVMLGGWGAKREYKIELGERASRDFMSDHHIEAYDKEVELKLLIDD